MTHVLFLLALWVAASIIVGLFVGAYLERNGE
jgi:uncharacterized protein YneF (UPF0154 family)